MFFCFIWYSMQLIISWRNNTCSFIMKTSYLGDLQFFHKIFTHKLGKNHLETSSKPFSIDNVTFRKNRNGQIKPIGGPSSDKNGKRRDILSFFSSNLRRKKCGEKCEKWGSKEHQFHGFYLFLLPPLGNRPVMVVL